MATIYRCDRCKKDFTDGEKLRRIELPNVDSYGDFFEDWKTVKELCGRCVKSLTDALELPTEEKKG